MKYKAQLLLLVGIFTSIQAIACPKNKMLAPLDMGSSLSRVYAKSIFLYRGGTAYYIGGNPGYLITAHHVTTDSDPINSGKDEICTPFIPDENNQRSCFEVVVKSSLVDLDLALLELKEPIPNHVPPLLLSNASKPATGDKSYSIISFSRRTESSSQSYSVVKASIDTRSEVTTNTGSINLKNLDVYHVGGPQYKGGSGSPFIDPTGYVAGTVVRGVDSYSQAYAIPHDTQQFTDWLLDNTSPSDETIKLVEKLRKSNLKEARNTLSCVLDVRIRTISSLDLMHAYRIIAKSVPWHLELALQPLSRATATNTDWTRIASFSGVKIGPSSIASLAEVNKELAWEYVSDSQNKVSTRYWLQNAAINASKAAGVLSGVVPRSDDPNRKEFEEAILASWAGEVISKSTEIKELTNKTSIRNVKSRIALNARDVARAQLASYKISEDETEYKESLKAWAYTVNQKQGLDASSYSNELAIIHAAKQPSSGSSKINELFNSVPQKGKWIITEDIATKISSEALLLDDSFKVP